MAAVLDEALLAECRQLLDRACTGNEPERGQAAVMSTELLDRAAHALEQGMMTPPYYARVLRACANMRNMARLPDLPPDPLVHDLIAHTVQYGLAAHNAAAQALRGALAVSRGAIGEAVDAAIDAVATIELLSEHTVERALAISDTGSLLDRLGLSDQAAELHSQAAVEFDLSGNGAYAVMSIADQVRSQLLHALWLERLGEAADSLFETAAGLATDALARIHRPDDPIELEEDFLADFYAAVALADPGSTDEPTLRKATERCVQPGQMLAGLALARALAAGGREDEAAAVLADVRAAGRGVQLPLPLRLALARGTARSGHESDYAAVLEAELWSARQALARSLHAGLEYERLRRGREPMRLIAAKDPVTRLPNRSVLDDLLSSLGTGDRPDALAMVDVDDLVQINQRGSYADGDDVLRAVAVTLRSVVRPEDSVVRYSGDEFVVLLPGVGLDEAADTMRRIVSAVAALAHDRAHGATVSIGVVAVNPSEGGESALVRADNAMVEARERGGNQVVVDPTAPAAG